MSLLDVHLVTHSIWQQDKNTDLSQFSSKKQDLIFSKQFPNDADFKSASIISENLYFTVDDLLNHDKKAYKMMESSQVVQLLEGKQVSRIEKDKYEETVVMLKKAKNRKERKDIVSNFVSSYAWGDVKKLPPKKIENKEITKKPFNRNTFQISAEKLNKRVRQLPSKFQRKVSIPNETAKVESLEYQLKTAKDKRSKSVLGIDPVTYNRAKSLAGTQKEALDVAIENKRCRFN